MAHPKSLDPTVSIREEISTSHSREELDSTRRRPWIPWTLKAAGLVPVALFTALLILALALLQWQSARRGGLYFANLSAEFLPYETLLYRYLPTILIVFYGTVWSWIDLDAKRLEPWFQLAKKNGSLGSDSLLLKYPLQFLPVVPVKAARKRQWMVVIASTVMILVVWAVTPLQNGIFAVRIVEVETPTPMKVVESLVSPADQIISTFRKGFLNVGFGVAWLGQRPPPFTTKSYSVMPFETVSEGPGARWDPQNQTMSAPTILYQTTLDCRAPPNISVEDTSESSSSGGEYQSVSVVFNNGDGCAPLLTFPDSPYGNHTDWNPFYLPYWNDPNLERSLAYEGCSEAYQHSFLAVWAPDSPDVNFEDGSNAAALFCTPSYYKQSVIATVKVSDSSIVSTVPTGERIPLLETEFNMTHFEYMVGVGSGPDSFMTASLHADPAAFEDVSSSNIVHQDSQLLEHGIAVPANNMVGYALGLSDKDLSKLKDPEKLQEAFEQAHQLLFALAIHDAMPSTNQSVIVNGMTRSTLQAVQVVPAFSIASLSLLVFILVFTGILLLASSKRPNCLSRDPNSLAEVAAIAGNGGFQRLVERADHATEEELCWLASKQVFHLEAGGDATRPSLGLRNILDDSFAPVSPKSPVTSSSSRAGMVGPKEYGWLIGGPIILFLLAMAVGLILVHRKINAENGLAPFSSNSTVQNLLTNALPPLLATILEPFWILITRISCIMKPMEELQNMSVDARRSLLLKYNSLPPQLNIWRALRARHFMIAVLALVATLANVLTIALAGIFIQRSVLQIQESTSMPIYTAVTPSDLPNGSPVGNDTFGSSQADAYLVALSNFTSGASLPPWTSSQYFFLPVDIQRPETGDGQEYTLTTRGYGGDLTCQELSTNPSDDTISITFNSTATDIQLVARHMSDDGSAVTCYSGLTMSGIPDRRKGFELYGKFSGSRTDSRGRVLEPNETADSLCYQKIYKGWVRADLKMEPDNGNQQQNSSTSRILQQVEISNLETAFVSCQSRLKSVPFNITVSSVGTILSSVPLGGPLYDDPSTNLNKILSEANELISGTQPKGGAFWHNGTLTADWVQEMIRALSGSTAFIDPATPLPDFATTSSTLIDLYGRLFAIQMSLRTRLLLTASASAAEIPTQIISFQTRTFMVESMFNLALAILCFDIAVALFFYLQTPRPFLPRLPTTIISQLAFFGGSHLWEDIREAAHKAPDSELLDLAKDGRRYGYGSYVARGGRTHVGIEQVPFVQQVALARKRKGWI